MGGSSTTFSYSTDDELTGTSGGISNSYGYNANGEQTSRTLAGTAYTLAWGYDGELSSITQGSTTVSFAYDGLGRRISRTAGGTTTQFLSSGDTGDYQVYLEAQGSTVTAKYGYGNALYRKDGEFPLFDGLGSERTVTNGSQTVTGTINFDAFGQTVGTTGSSSNPYMFAATSGYRSDGDAGLMHVRARYYDGQVGRFVSRDTLLDEHPYLYCDADPVNHVDPTGHAPPVIYLVVLVVVAGVRTYRTIRVIRTLKEAQRLRRLGENILVRGNRARRTAERIEDGVPGPTIRHGIGHPSNPTMSHFQTPAHHGHTFYAR